jgi:outer membrane protein
MGGLCCVLLLAVAGCAGVGKGAGGTSIGTVDPQRILNETNAGKRTRDSLAAFTKNRQALVELEEKELRRLEEDFVKQSSVLSANAKREREEQFRRRVSEYQQKVGELNREIQEKQKEALDSFRDKIEIVVSKVAKQMGLTVVLDRGRGGPAVYSDDTTDISARVIEEFNKEYK